METLFSSDNLPDYFSSLEQLNQACFSLMPIDEHLRLSPALRSTGEQIITYPWAWKTMAVYGIQLVVPEGDISSRQALVAALLGFSLEGSDMVITNSPQGLGRKLLTIFSDVGIMGVKYSEDEVSKIMRELKKVDPQTGWNFRDILLEGAIKVAHSLKNLGISRIAGISAANSSKVSQTGEKGTLSLEKGRKAMDLLYERHGFEQIPPSFNYFREIV